MINLLQETVEKIIAHGHSPTDVQFVKNRDTCCSWQEFAAVADFEYDPGYGANEIALALKVVGKDWWLERCEYDGSEWWAYKTVPLKPDSSHPFTKDEILSFY